MFVTMIQTDPCGVCGYVRKGYLFPTVRVNKRSIRSVRGTTIRVTLDRCRECGSVTGMPPVDRWRLLPEDAAKVDAYRLKRWPELAEEAP